MSIQEILNSRGNGLHYNQILSLTEPHSSYPGKTPASRIAILRHLAKLDEQSLAVLNELAFNLRSKPFPKSLTSTELYMLRQRLLCGLDTLSRLADSAPNPDYLSTNTSDLEIEDRWLLIGIWREFGTHWIQNLAWRISRGSIKD